MLRPVARVEGIVMEWIIDPRDQPLRPSRLVG
jgi:hypothetical protein